MFSSTAEKALSLHPSTKRLVALAVDVNLCLFSTWLAFSFWLGGFANINEWIVWPGIFAVIVALSCFQFCGLYRTIVRYSGWPAIQAVGRAMMIYSLFYTTVVTIVGLDDTPKMIGLIQPVVLFVLVAGSRLLGRLWLDSIHRPKLQKDLLPGVAIYGAGSAGRQLARVLHNSREMRLVGFIDDDDRLNQRVLNGFPVFSPNEVEWLIASSELKLLLLAMPSISRARRNEILAHLTQYPVVVRTLPSLADIAEGRVSIKDIRDLDLDDLLGRDTVAPNQLLLARKVTDRKILVTGAGGSIGSELCRQILTLNPSLLLLLEISEFGLYSIHNELETMRARLGISNDLKIIPLLCSVQNRDRVTEIVSTWRPDIIYHAAAYKHVPLVEHNLFEGIRNNVFGTQIVAEVAIQTEVSDFVLVSTDKAVRPTNIMGATKRLAEMILQALDERTDSKTCFSMVRFGNVLDSSGSVIPKFKSQILGGGPVTVTHTEVNRFFMTIPEAAQLVIQAGAIAEGGEVFVLDMGEPVKILELAKRMIHLFGLTEKSSANPEGDIAIDITGLRSGEKLYEELLIEGDPKPTPHPKIMRANESVISWLTLRKELELINGFVNDNQATACFIKLKELVGGFQPQGGLLDWVFLEQSK